MRILIQRVTKASVTINVKEKRSIKNGLVILLGIEEEDTEDDIDYLIRKTINLRIFDDENGVMNRSVIDINGDILAISQFTLHASTKKGNRPSYIKAAKPDIAIPLYDRFIEKLEAEFGKTVTTGEFGADMQVELINDGPVTIWIDSKVKE